RWMALRCDARDDPKSSSGSAEKITIGVEGPVTTVQQSPSEKIRKNETMPQELDRRLRLYTLAAGTPVGAAPESHAEVVFTPSNAVLQGFGKLDIDLDNDGSADFSILARWTVYDTSNMIQALFAYGNRSSQQIAMRGGVAAKLRNGTEIGP